ncbi:MAG TPA: hypothetical protein VL282_07140, partial [Tepidisphaeraceae bacterium]|nr:hypothetical protein [Tepidisphaeraceae bacterium]
MSRGRQGVFQQALALAGETAILLTVSNRVWVVILLAVGLGLWLITDRATPTALQVQFGLLAVVLCLIPNVNRFLARQIERLRHASPQQRAVAAVIVALVSFIYIYLTSLEQGRSFRMILHDEFMFRLQSQMLAHGRLWMPEHTLADFFETFYVINRPVTAAIYYPGTA